MTSSSSEPNFNNNYLVFGHGARLVNKKDGMNIDSNFPLDSNYRIVTLHMPGEQIYNKLVKIITNQISKKAQFINNLFLIQCPIARGKAKKELENMFIRDYFIDMFKTNPEKLPVAMADILYEDPESINIRTLDDLTKILDNLTYDDIKDDLNLEIRTYRPGDLCPKLLIDFNSPKSLGNLKGGIYKVEDFSNFNLDDYNEIQDLMSGSTSIESQQLKSVVKFNNSLKYVLDDADSLLGRGESFFTKINSRVPSGLLIILSCGSYSSKPHPYVRQASFERQNNTPYRKYYIKYD